MTNGTRISLILMRMALALLDEADEGLAAVRVQEAIEVVEGGAAPASSDGMS